MTDSKTASVHQLAHDAITRPFTHPESKDEYDILGFVQTRQLSIAVAQPELVQRVEQAILSYASDKDKIIAELEAEVIGLKTWSETLKDSIRLKDGLWEQRLGELAFLKSSLAEKEAELARIQRLPTLKWAEASADIMLEFASTARGGDKEAAQKMLAAFDKVKTYVNQLEANLTYRERELDRHIFSSKVCIEGRDAQLASLKRQLEQAKVADLLDLKGCVERQLEQIVSLKQKNEALCKDSDDYSRGCACRFNQDTGELDVAGACVYHERLEQENERLKSRVLSDPLIEILLYPFKDKLACLQLENGVMRPVLNDILKWWEHGRAVPSTLADSATKALLSTSTKSSLMEKVRGLIEAANQLLMFQSREWKEESWKSLSSEFTSRKAWEDNKKVCVELESALTEVKKEIGA